MANSATRTGKVGVEVETTPPSPRVALYGVLMQHRIHQDRLMWQTVQIQLIVQFATIAAAYAIARQRPELSIVMMIVAMLVASMISALAWKHWRHSVANEPLMNELSESLRGELELSSTPRFGDPHWITGRGILACGYVAFVILDLALALLFAARVLGASGGG